MLLADQTFLFNLDAQLLFDTALLAVSVLVLFLVMSYLLFNPARKFLKNRQDRIADDISSAKEDKEAAAALLAEYEQKLADIGKEADAILSEARQNALENEKKIIEEGKAEADRIIRHAQDEAKLQMAQAQDEMKKEMVVLSSLIAQQVVTAQIDATVQEQLVDETIRQMGEATWQS